MNVAHWVTLAQVFCSLVTTTIFATQSSSITTMTGFTTSLLIFSLLRAILAQNSFVSDVVCQFDHMDVTLDTEAAALSDIFGDDDKVNPAIISINNKTDSRCQFQIENMDDRNFAIPITPNHCAIMVLNLEPEFTAVQAHVTIKVGKTNVTILGLVYCLFSSIVSGTIGGDDPKPLSVNSSVLHGGVSGTKPDVKLELMITSTSGDPVNSAVIGDQLHVNVSITQNIYAAVEPYKCFFSPFKDFTNDSVALTFVENGCPLEAMKDLIQPMKYLNDTSYSSSFKAFRFHSGLQNTLYIHCTVKLCVHRENCIKECFNATKPAKSSSGRKRLRGKRETSKLEDTSLHAIHKLNVFNHPKTDTHVANKGSLTSVSCLPKYGLWLMLTCICIVFILLVISCGIIVKLSTRTIVHHPSRSNLTSIVGSRPHLNQGRRNTEEYTRNSHYLM